MELFEIVNGHAVPSTHVLLISPFKEMWERDISPHKAEVIKVFTYIELLCSPKKSNPFVGYSEEDRPSKVKKQVWGDEDYPTDTDTLFAVLKYKELLSISSPSYGLYVSAVNAVHKLRVFLDELNMNATTPSGSLVLKPKDVTAALKDLNDVEKNMEASRDRVHGELIDSSKTRNQRTIGMFER